MAIIMLVSGLIYLAVAPGAKRGAIETRIRSDLRQISQAIAIYRSDWDDEIPLSLTNLPPSVPTEYPNWPETSVYCDGCGIGVARYRLAYTGRMRRIVRYYDVGMEYDESKHVLVDAPFYQRDTGTTYRVPRRTADGGTRQARVPLIKVLGARSDTSVHWKPFLDEWQRSIADFGLKPLPN